MRVNIEEGQSDSLQRPVSAAVDDRDALISECVEKVLEIMKREEQR